MIRRLGGSDQTYLTTWHKKLRCANCHINSLNLVSANIHTTIFSLSLTLP